MPRNTRQPLELAEQAQIRRLVRELGEPTAASALGVGVHALRRAADGLALNQTTRDRMRASGWIVPSSPPVAEPFTVEGFLGPITLTPKARSL
jgi:hypothetical protein